MKVTCYLLTLVALCSSVLMGCENTVKGFGQDMQHTGQEIQNSAS
jgi:predicted small secreted protein